MYAVEPDASEMNPIDRIYRYRDIKFERGGLGIILPEDEFKKHQKEGTWPPQPEIE